MVWWKAVSNTATCGSAGKSSWAISMPRRFGGLWSGPSGMHSRILSTTSGVTGIEPGEAGAAVHHAMPDALDGLRESDLVEELADLAERAAVIGVVEDLGPLLSADLPVERRVRRAEPLRHAGDLLLPGRRVDHRELRGGAATVQDEDVHRNSACNSIHEQENRLVSARCGRLDQPTAVVGTVSLATARWPRILHRSHIRHRSRKPPGGDLPAWRALRSVRDMIAPRRVATWRRVRATIPGSSLAHGSPLCR